MTLPYDIVAQIPPDRPVLIAGPTASGKSALALEIAQTQGGVIINADAIQVYDNWRILTARPSPEDESRAPHALYGHVPRDGDYSVGHWLRDVAPLLKEGPRPIITGGTGLYFMALTQGLADIPATPPQIRAEADARVAAEGFERLLAELDPKTAARIDRQNPMRVQRAWEVFRATGQPLAAWQDDTPPPLLADSDCTAILFDVERDWLNARIAARFQKMLDLGALNEARANLADWSPKRLSSKAIGAADLIAHLRGEISLDQAAENATIATRQFAKRQRTWFRSKMSHWAKFRP
ncbi:MAG: tRNA (adenosine(37)-N6)-dimethylallyltransferase MiaA [Rhodobacteraceae bacterium]|nr:tRNA (adenosine(37)-N6)-dimethylallyltransferase MiaA [Paracoccaceae bacterium]MCW9042934.1 tRNA (adenosine(37)-N6)-dimethylallyltransferase MiaA [Pseudopelagicola sp.]